MAHANESGNSQPSNEETQTFSQQILYWNTLR